MVGRMSEASTGVVDAITKRATARVGSALSEKYRLEGLLGIGGMAAVYKGKHRNGNRVAVKVLHAELSIHHDIRARFLREGYVANTVDHSGAVRVIDDDLAADGSVFLVMELLEGDTLQARANRAGGKLPPAEVLGAMHQALEVLAAAHAKQIVHRDIKPENLFMTKDGFVKVHDFGIAHLRDSDDWARATQTGIPMGTPAFMPPEQALGRRKEIDGQTDIWALGATMFTLLSGKSVHISESSEETLVFAATRPAPSLASVEPGLPAELVALVDKALSFKREDRFADAKEMRTALENAYRTLFDAVVPEPQAPRPSSADLDRTVREEPAVREDLTVREEPAARKDVALSEELTIREEPRPAAAKLDKLSLDATAHAVLPWELRKRAEEVKVQRAEPTMVGTARPAPAVKAEEPTAPKPGSLWGPIGVAYALVALCGSGYLYLRKDHSVPPPPAPSITVSASTPTAESIDTALPTIAPAVVPLPIAPLPIVQAAPAPQEVGSKAALPAKPVPARSATPKGPVVTPQGFLDQP